MRAGRRLLPLLFLLLAAGAPTLCRASEATVRFELVGSDLVLQTDNGTGRLVIDAADVVAGNASLTSIQAVANATATISQQATTIAQLQVQVASAMYTGDLTLTGSGIDATLPFSAVYGLLNVTEFALSTLSPLAQLSAIGGTLWIFNNSALTSLSGLDRVTGINGSLIVQSNGALSSLAGLDAVQYINGYGLIADNALENTTHLTSLQSIDGALSVSGSSNCTTPTEGFVVCESSLRELSGLDRVTSIGGAVSVQNASALSSISGLNGVTEIGGGITIASNALLTSIAGLNNVTNIDGDVVIQDNAQLVNVSGLRALTAIEGALLIESNGQLANISGLSNLQTIDGSVSIYNTSLVDLAGLQIASTGSLTVAYNDALKSLTGLEQLTVINGDLLIANNTALTSVAALTNVVQIAGSLTIHGNPNLTMCVSLVGYFYGIVQGTNSFGYPNVNIDSEAVITQTC